MKTIPNRQFTVKFQTEDKKGMTTAQLVKLTLAQPPTGGFTFAEMRIRNRIADIVEKVKSGGDIKLEDADYASARTCIENCRWPIAHPDLTAFAEQFGL